MAKKKDSAKTKKDDENYFPIPGFLLVGIGVGLLIGEVASFTLIGLGLGFLVSYLFSKRR